ncbi:MAG: 50S ribosomal protein L1 [bacterium]
MKKRGKRYTTAKALIEPGKRYELNDAISLIKGMPQTKFDESVDIAVVLGVNPRKADQMVRGTVVLPHGTGKTLRILVFAKGEKEKEAQEAGADYVGGDELVEKIRGGWLEFDRTVATPDMMSSVGKLGKILGPRGLMPNPKTGTVTFDVARVIQEIKKGKVDFKVEKNGILHVSIGKISLNAQQLMDNASAFIDAVIKLKPSTSKGQYIKNLAIASTMGPGVKLDVVQIRNMFR